MTLLSSCSLLPEWILPVVSTLRASSLLAGQNKNPPTEVKLCVCLNGPHYTASKVFGEGRGGEIFP